MTLLILGLLLFLGSHSITVVAPAWRQATLQRLGENVWKSAYSVVSLAGLALVVVGYGQARLDPVTLWVPPVALRHVALLLMLVSWVLLVAFKLPAGHFRTWVGHPMVLGVKTWALAHLLANGSLHAVVLFGSFLAWSVVCYASLRSRDRAAGVKVQAGSWSHTMLAVALGVVIYGVFVLYLHAWLIGKNVV